MGSQGPAVHVIERFHNVLMALGAEQKSWPDIYWLRFAAQISVEATDDAETAARRIKKIADVLGDNASWMSAFSSPARFALAALLLQSRVLPKFFVSYHEEAQKILRAERIRRGGFHETMAIFIFMLTHEKEPLSTEDAVNLRTIYNEMKTYHWWLTGPEDLPACAALMQKGVPPKMVAAEAEQVYQYLHNTGIQNGEHLQMVSNLLSIIGLSVDDAVSRYLAIDRVYRKALHVDDAQGHEAVVVLSVLEQEPVVVIHTMMSIREEIEKIQLAHYGPEHPSSASTTMIAVDLTVLDLMRYDKDMVLLEQPEIEKQEDTLRRFHVIQAALLSRFDSSHEAVKGSSASC